jgi:hypothetical protein
MGEVVGSVFFSKYEAPDGTRLEPMFNIDESYRSPEFDAEIYSLMNSLGASYPKAEEVITAAPKEAVAATPPGAVRSPIEMTRNDYQKDQASLGQVPTQLMPEGFSFANERGELLSVKELIDTYGDKVVNNLATLYGVRVKDLKRNAEKLLKIQQNLRAVEGLTEEQLNAMTVSSCRNWQNRLALQSLATRPDWLAPFQIMHRLLQINLTDVYRTSSTSLPLSTPCATISPFQQSY